VLAATIALIFLPVNCWPRSSSPRAALKPNVVLRQQLHRTAAQVDGRIPPKGGDRFFFVPLYRWFPAILRVI